MLLDLDIGRCHPLELPIDLDPLFLVDNPIMEYAGDLGGVALGRIRVTFSHFAASGFHSTLRTAPGPGARSFDARGLRR